MKALIREDEIWTEETWTQWTRDHIGWLTTVRPEGDGYTLVNDYTECSEIVVEEEKVPQDNVVEDDDYVIINGVRYSKDELRSMLE